MPKSDAQLLREYAEEANEVAFREIVVRHTDLIYSAALRQVASPDLARDVAQNVFTDLARKAASVARNLTENSSLVGWLYRGTRFEVLNLLRDERRRQTRERQAMEECTPTPETALEWDRLRPVLDEAMADLNDADRDAVLLRYFRNHDLREVGMALGITDDAAQKRVSRALEKLREKLLRRGITTAASTLTVVISATAVQAAPAGLALTVATAAALTGTAAPATITATKVIAMTTLQKSLIAATVVAVSVATPVLIQQQSQVRLRNANAALRQQVEQLSGLTAENERLSNLLAQANSASASNQATDLLRLRGEVGLLRQRTNELGKLRAENSQLRNAQAKATPRQSSAQSTEQTDLPRESWTFAGYANPESAVMSLAWAAAGADMENFLNSMTPEQQVRERDRWKNNGRTEAEVRDRVAEEFDKTKRIKILGKETISENEIFVNLLVEGQDGHTETPRIKMQRIGNDWKVAGLHEPPAGQQRP